MAVKELKMTGANDAGADDPMVMMNEARMMRRVCNHRSIVEFLGVIFRPHPCIVTSFMANGSVADAIVGPKSRRNR